MNAALCWCSWIALFGPPRPPGDDSTVTLDAEASVGVAHRVPRRGPWHSPPSAGASVTLRPSWRLFTRPWRLRFPLGYRSTVAAELTEDAPGASVTRRATADVLELGVEGLRRWSPTSGIGLELGAGLLADRSSTRSPVPGRLEDQASGGLQLRVPLAVVFAEGRVELDAAAGVGVAVGDRLGVRFSGGAGGFVRLWGRFGVSLRHREDGWWSGGTSRQLRMTTLGLALRSGAPPSRRRSPSPVGPPSKPPKAAPLRPAAQSLVTTTLDGAEFDLREHRGKVVVVDFWASWCAPCRDAMPALQRLRRETDPSDVVIIGVSLDDDEAAARAFAKAAGVDFPLAVDTSGIADAWQPPKMPSTILIDRDGRVAHVHGGFREGDSELLRRHVEGLVAEIAKSSR